MRIDPDDEVAGLPVLAVRDLMRRRVFDAKLAAQVLKIDPGEAAAVIERLAAEDYVCPSERFRSRDGGAWQTTPKGSKLANASTLPSIPHAEGDRIMADFMARVKTCAESDDFHAEVADVVLFGSYLAGAAEINDIDLVVRLRLKESFRTRSYDEALAAKAGAVKAAGRKFADARAWVAFLQTEVLEYLQAASPYISFHRADAIQLIEDADRRQNLPNPGTPHKTIYAAPALARRAARR